MKVSRLVVLACISSVCYVKGGLLRGGGHHTLDHDETSWFWHRNTAEQQENIATTNRAQKCLQDPDAPECHYQKQQQQQQWSQLVDFPEAMWEVFSPSHGLPKRKEDILLKEPRPIVSSSFMSNNFADNEENVVSSSPTRDLCYGNMERLAYKKYCHSEMPSISLEPTEMPTHYPHNPQVGEPWSHGGTPSILPSVMFPSLSLSPSSTIATLEPSPFPHNPTTIGMCHGDCNTPSDCDEGLYCFQRMNFDPVPGCPGSVWDGSRIDYCTNTTNTDDSPEVPSPIPTEDSFRLKLYWNSSYWWQESNEERKWCISCPRQPGGSPPTCHAGDVLFVHFCSSESVYFQTEPWGNRSDDTSSVIIQVVHTTLCLERHAATNVTLATCNTTNAQQEWTSPQAPWTWDESFEIIYRPRRSDDMCLTIHHHPKLGDIIKMIPCPASRHDNSSLWVMY